AGSLSYITYRLGRRQSGRQREHCSRAARCWLSTWRLHFVEPCGKAEKVSARVQGFDSLQPQSAIRQGSFSGIRRVLPTRWEQGPLPTAPLHHLVLVVP